MAVSAKGNIAHTLSAAVANAGTFTVAYPAGLNQAALTGTTGGQMVGKAGYPKFLQGASGITLTFGASNITVTNASGAAIPPGEYYLSFGEVDINGSYNLTWPKQVQDAALA